MFWLQANFFSARVYQVIVVDVKCCVIFKLMADTSKYTIEERLIVSVWVHEKNEMAKRRKKSEDISFFVSIKQLPVKPISEKPRPHKVRQLAVVLLQRKFFS